ncbi:MAG: gamma-glutamylcyclotransferase family protein [Bryobacterales bacterium]
MKIAFYGTLMRGFRAQGLLQVEAALRYEGVCRISGVLWDLGPYPGLTEGGGAVRGEVFAILDEGVLEKLDEFEGDEYVRRQVTLLEPQTEAWVYVLAQAPAGAKPIESGCWRTHALTRGARRSS